MTGLEEKINKEKKHFIDMKNRTYAVGSAFIIVGIVFGLILGQGEGIARTAGVLTAALYIGVGGNLLTRYINIKHEEEKSIRYIHIEDKINEISTRIMILEIKNDLQVLREELRRNYE